MTMKELQDLTDDEFEKLTVKEIEAYLVDGGIDVDGLLERVEKLLKNRRSVYEHTAKNL
jgi:hypothetical protein